MSKKILASSLFGLASSFFMLTLVACDVGGSKPENVVMQSEKPLVEPQSSSSGMQAEWTKTASYEDVVSSVNSDEVSKTNSLATKAMVKNLSKDIDVAPNSLTAPEIPLSNLSSPYSAYDKTSDVLVQDINLNELFFDIDYAEKPDDSKDIKDKRLVTYDTTDSYDAYVSSNAPWFVESQNSYYIHTYCAYPTNPKISVDCGGMFFTDLSKFYERTLHPSTNSRVPISFRGPGIVDKFYYLSYALPRGVDSFFRLDQNTDNNYALYEVDCSTVAQHGRCAKVTKINIPDSIKAKLPKVPNERSKYVDLLDKNKKPLEDPSQHKDFLGYSIRFKAIADKKEIFPFKLKRKLVWIEDESALAEAGQDRPLYMYPGNTFSLNISTTTGVADSVGTNWSQEVGISSTTSNSDELGASLTLATGIEAGASYSFLTAKKSLSLSATVSYSHTWSNSTTNSNSSTNGGSTNRTTNSQTSTTKSYNFSPPNSSSDGNNNYMRHFTYWKLVEKWELQKPDGNLLNDSDLRVLLLNALYSINSDKKGLEPNYQAFLCAKYKNVHIDKEGGSSYEYSKHDCSQLKPKIDYAIDQMRLKQPYEPLLIKTGTYHLIKTADDVATKNFARGDVQLRNLVHTIDWRRSDMVDMLTGIWNNETGTASSSYFIIDTVNINTKTFNLTYETKRYLGSYQDEDKMVLVPLDGTAQSCTPPYLRWTWPSKKISLTPGNCKLPAAGTWGLSTSTWAKQ